MPTAVSGSDAADDVAQLARQPPDPALLADNQGFARARVLATAIEVGLFTALSVGPGHAVELADRLECDREATRRLLAALITMDLVGHEADGRFTLTASSRRSLVAGQPGDLAPHLLAVMDQWGAWESLTDVVRGAPRTGQLGDFRARDRNIGFFAGSFPLAVSMVQSLTANLELPSNARVLDYAAGGGEWGICLTARSPDITVTARDTPAVLESLRRRVKGFGLEDRYSFLPVDVMDGPPPGGPCDVVVLAQLGRFLGPKRAEQLVARAAETLRPGGQLLVGDVLSPEPGQRPGVAGLLDLSLLVNTSDGRLLSRCEYEAYLTRTGLQVSGFARAGLLSVLIGKR